jgi:hypothetical protein
VEREEMEEQHDEGDGRAEEGNTEQMRPLQPSGKRRPTSLREEKSDEPEDEQEKRRRKSRQRRSELLSSKTVEEVIDEYIGEHGSDWSPLLRSNMEGRLLTCGVNLTIHVVEGKLKQRLSELNSQ